LPPKDSAEQITPHDDQFAVPDDSRLVRYINPDEHLTALPDKNCYRLNSGAFSPSSRSVDIYQGISVDLLDGMEKEGVTISQQMSKGTNLAGAVTVTAGDARRLGLMVGPDPRPGRPFHTAIWGRSGPATQSQRRQLSRQAQWLIYPPSHPIG
jgi:hypothetical protein